MIKIKGLENKIILILATAAALILILPTGALAASEDSKIYANEDAKTTAFTGTHSSVNTASFTLIPKDFLPKAPLTPITVKKTQVKLEPNIYFQKRQRREKLQKTLFNITLATSAALNIVDYFSTREALRHEGLAEGNPMLKPFVKNDLAFAAVKAGLLTVNHLLLKNLYKKNKTMAWILSVANNFVLSYVLVNNLKLIREI